MKGIHLRFYTYANRRHGSALLYEWLLELAKRQGIQGGSAFRAIAGYGRHGKLHEEHFFELAGDVSVEVAFALSEEEACSFLAHLDREQLRLFYIKVPLEMGVVGGGA